MSKKLPVEGTPDYLDLCRLVLSSTWEEVAELHGVTPKHVRNAIPRRRALAYLSSVGELVAPPVKTVTEVPVGEVLDPEKLSIEERKILGLLPASVGALSRDLDRSRETVIKLLDSLRSKHFDVQLDDKTREVSIPQSPAKEFAPTDFQYFRKSLKVGLVSDTHAGSKYQQMTLLHDAYSHFDRVQTDFNLHAGDITDGLNMYRGHTQELFLHGADDQRDYVVQNYPRSSRGTRTYIVGGNHDYSYYKQNGYDIVEHICAERDDLVYRGAVCAQFIVKDFRIDLRHPDGGVAYARSYKPQKLIENMVGFYLDVYGSELTKYRPHACFMGHWHVPIHLPSYMGIDGYSLPCFQAQTPYLAAKGLMPAVGYVILEISFDDDNHVTSIKEEYINLSKYIKEKDY